MLELFYLAGKASKMERYEQMFDKETEAKLNELHFVISGYARYPLTYGDKLKELEAEYDAIVEQAKAKQTN
jgi:hypothetical protein